MSTLFKSEQETKEPTGSSPCVSSPVLSQPSGSGILPSSIRNGSKDKLPFLAVCQFFPPDLQGSVHQAMEPYLSKDSAEIKRSMMDDKQSQKYLQKPFHNSLWIKETKRYLNNGRGHVQGALEAFPEDKGIPKIVATYFTGGILSSADPSVYFKSLWAMAKDLEQGVTLTVSQVAQDDFGVVCFLDIDIKHPTKLPSSRVVKKFLGICFDTCMEMFPSANDHSMVVSVCPPKLRSKKSQCNMDDLKMGRKKKPVKKPKTSECSDSQQEKQAGDELSPGVSDASSRIQTESVVSWGVHVVWPNVVTTCDSLRLFARTAGLRIAASNKEFGNGAVDTNPINSVSAQMRVNGSKKATKCPYCTVEPPKGLDVFGNVFPRVYDDDKVKRAVDLVHYYDAEYPESVQAACPGRCNFNRKVVQQGTYRVAMWFRKMPGTPKAYEVVTYLTEESKKKPKTTFEQSLAPTPTLRELQLTSISPSKIVPFHKRCLAVKAADTPETPHPCLGNSITAGLRYESDRVVFLNEVQKNSYCHLDPGRNAQLYTVVQSIITLKFGQRFKNALVSNIKNGNNQSLFINITGPGNLSNSCPFKRSQESKESDLKTMFIFSQTPTFHTSNSIFFILEYGQTRRPNMVHLRCFKKECRKVANTLQSAYLKKWPARKKEATSLCAEISRKVADNIKELLAPTNQPTKRKRSVSDTNQVLHPDTASASRLKWTRDTFENKLVSSPGNLKETKTSTVLTALQRLTE